MLLLAGKEDKEPSADVLWSSGFEAQDYSFPACAQQSIALQRARGQPDMQRSWSLLTWEKICKIFPGLLWASLGCLLFEVCLGQTRSPQSWAGLLPFVIGALGCLAEQGRWLVHPSSCSWWFWPRVPSRFNSYLLCMCCCSYSFSCLVVLSSLHKRLSRGSLLSGTSSRPRRSLATSSSCRGNSTRQLSRDIWLSSTR